MPAHPGSDPVPVVIIDADPVQRRILSNYLQSRPGQRYAPVACETADQARALARNSEARIMVADLESIGGAGKIVEFTGSAGPVIATSSRGSVHSAVAAMRAGAADFVSKPIGAAALVERLEAAITAWQSDPARSLAKNALAKSPAAAPAPAAVARRPRPQPSLASFVGQSAAMQSVYSVIDRIAPSQAPVFITGESGTGKELCAEAIHARSGRDRAFIALNCSAIPKDLIESEIFGHVRGAFTGATENRPGAAELADGGTLFLDEIGEMDLSLQAKLLRFIQTGTVRRVGGSETMALDVRFVCATNRDPLTELRAGRFREDLFYRLNVLPIRMPPLRDRPEDILSLAHEFLARFTEEEGRAFEGFHTSAADLLTRYAWPGNVRQLQNVIRRIVVLYDGTAVTPAMLPRELLESDPEDTLVQASISAPSPLVPFWRQERQIIEAAIAACDGNIARAAAALELSPSTLYRKRQAWAEGRTA